jgi:hypothetical protein
MDDVDQFKRFGLPAGSARGNPGRAAHLRRIQHIREGTGGHEKPRDNTALGQMVLSIPELDYYVLIRRFPDLESPDGEIRKAAWLKFIKDDASLPYRIYKGVNP